MAPRHVCNDFTDRNQGLCGNVLMSHVYVWRKFTKLKMNGVWAVRMQLAARGRLTLAELGQEKIRKWGVFNCYLEGLCCKLYWIPKGHILPWLWGVDRFINIWCWALFLWHFRALFIAFQALQCKKGLFHFKN